MFEETPQEQSLTNSDSTTIESNVETNEGDLFADKLSSITTPDGRQKYADVATALDSIPHAQGRINELSEQVKLLEEELQKRSGMEEMQRQVQPSTPEHTEQPSTSGLDEHSVEALLERKLAQMEQTKAAEANANKVRSSLTEAYGDKAAEVFNNRAKELGVTPSYLSELAKQSPELVLSHFSEAKRPTAQPLGDGVRTEAMKPSAPERKAVMYGASSKDVLEQFRAHKD